ncbi:MULTISPECIES: hypothetical protein [Streptomyces]|uniref:hypothetical protein n=1 Tax=Streptomyces TaxID=1883 RepID=UPI002E2B82B9|nr:MULTISPECIES: hypothetical protein [Streptomyces]
MAVSLIKDNPLAYSGRSLLDVAMESAHNTSERAFQLGRELDATRRELEGAEALLDLHRLAGLCLVTELDRSDSNLTHAEAEVAALSDALAEAESVIAILRDVLVEVRRTRDEREQVLRDELECYRALASSS